MSNSINSGSQFIPINNYGRRSSSATEYLAMQKILETDSDYEPTLRIKEITDNTLKAHAICALTDDKIRQTIRHVEDVFEDAVKKGLFSIIVLPSSPRLTPIECKRECRANIEKLQALLLSSEEAKELTFKKEEVMKSKEVKISGLGLALVRFNKE